jgi:hypothetical protein
MDKLTYKELTDMQGTKVMVEDNTFDYENQICVVSCSECIDTCPICGHSIIYGIVQLENNEFSFEYNAKGECDSGEFTVYKLD